MWNSWTVTKPNLLLKANMTKEKLVELAVPVEKKTLLARLASLLHLGRSPETTEDLEQEIQELLEEGEEQGLISSLEERMINSIFDFHDTLVAEVMTPMFLIPKSTVGDALDWHPLLFLLALLLKSMPFY